MYYRAQTIIARKVLKEVEKLKTRSHLESLAYQRTVDTVLLAYREFYEDAEARMKETIAENPQYLSTIDDRFGQQSLRKAFEEGLGELLEKNMLSPKVAILLENQFRGRT